MLAEVLAGVDPVPDDAGVLAEVAVGVDVVVVGDVVVVAVGEVGVAVGEVGVAVGEVGVGVGVGVGDGAVPPYS